MEYDNGFTGLFRKVIDSASDAIVLLENFRVIYSNKMFQSLVAIDEMDIIDQPILKFIAQEDLMLVKDNLILAQKTPNYTSHIKCRLINKYNEVVYVEIMIQKIASEGLQCIMISFNDISHLISQDDLKLRYSSNIRFLNDTAIEFIKMVEVDDVFDYIIKKLHDFLVDVMVIVLKKEPHTDNFTIVKTSKLDSMVYSILSFVKLSFSNAYYKFPEAILERLVSGKIFELSGGVEELGAGKISSFNATVIEKILFLDKLFLVGLAFGSKVFGCVAIMTKKKTLPLNKSLLENFIFQASATLQRKILEEELNDEKDFQLALIEKLPFPLLITDRRGDITYASRNIEAIIGWLHTEIVGKNIFNFINSLYHKAVLNQYLQVIQNSSISEIYLLHHKDGHEVFCEITAEVLNTHAGKERQFVVILNDITSRINYENELESSKNRAEESDKLKTAFLSNLSHEIRTPMNAIIGFSELLKFPGISTTEHEEYLSIINNSSKQLLALINDIIDISRIESGEMTLDFQSFSLHDLCDEIVEYFRSYRLINLESYEQIDIIFSPDLSMNENIISDKQRLNQILTNLISNALKYTTKGVVELGFSDEKNGYIKIFVRDTGIGIDSSLHEEIFERFKMIQNDAISRSGRSGLGLPIAKSLIELLKGSIHVESKPKAGSLFYILLPYVISHESPSHPVQRAYPISRKNERILIVEDEENNFIFLSTYLKKKFNLIAERASTGLEALQMVTANDSYALIFMDMNMPELDGYEATRELRERGITTTIIASTAYATTDDRKRSFDAGCTDYLAKPINPNRLEELVRKYVF